MPNEVFREYVTRVGFDLSLSRSHISALVQLDQMLANNIYLGSRFSARARAAQRPDNFVVGVKGLQWRGLVEHVHYQNEARREKWKRENGPLSWAPPAYNWRITSTGAIVTQLLREAGLYNDYALSQSEIDEEIAENNARIAKFREEEAVRRAHRSRPSKRLVRA